MRLKRTEQVTDDLFQNQHPWKTEAMVAKATESAWSSFAAVLQRPRL